MTKDIKNTLEKITDYFTECRGYSRSLINYGDCWLWALIVYKLVPGSILCSSLSKYGEGGHAFIKYESKYYDSDAPEGRPDWLYLDFFYRMHSEPSEHERDYVHKENLEPWELQEWCYGNTVDDLYDRDMVIQRVSRV